MNNMKKYIKLIATESLFMLAAAFTAGLTCALQFVGKKYLRGFEGSVFSGSFYEYNALAFITGMILFWGVGVILYKKIYEKSAKQIVLYKLPYRILAWLVILVWGFVMFGALVIAGATCLGLSDKMEPNGFLEIVIFGRPILLVVALGIDLFVKSRLASKNQ